METQPAPLDLTEHRFLQEYLHPLQDSTKIAQCKAVSGQSCKGLLLKEALLSPAEREYNQ